MQREREHMLANFTVNDALGPAAAVADQGATLPPFMLFETTYVRALWARPPTSRLLAPLLARARRLLPDGHRALGASISLRTGSCGSLRPLCAVWSEEGGEHAHARACAQVLFERGGGGSGGSSIRPSGQPGVSSVQSLPVAARRRAPACVLWQDAAEAEEARPEGTGPPVVLRLALWRLAPGAGGADTEAGAEAGREGEEEEGDPQRPPARLLPCGWGQCELPAAPAGEVYLPGPVGEALVQGCLRVRRCVAGDQHDVTSWLPSKEEEEEEEGLTAVVGDGAGAAGGESVPEQQGGEEQGEAPMPVHPASQPQRAPEHEASAAVPGGQAAEPRAAGDAGSSAAEALPASPSAPSSAGQAGPCPTPGVASEPQVPAGAGPVTPHPPRAPRPPRHTKPSPQQPSPHGPPPHPPSQARSGETAPRRPRHRRLIHSASDARVSASGLVPQPPVGRAGAASGGDEGGGESQSPARPKGEQHGVEYRRRGRILRPSLSADLLHSRWGSIRENTTPFGDGWHVPQPPSEAGSEADAAAATPPPHRHSRSPAEVHVLPSTGPRSADKRLLDAGRAVPSRTVVRRLELGDAGGAGSATLPPLAQEPAPPGDK